MRINPNTLGPAERVIFQALGNRRWTRKRYTKAAVTDARRVWRDVRKVVGFSTPGGWMTTQSTNPKLRKSGQPTIGVTLHAATGALTAWNTLQRSEQDALATALGTRTYRIDDLLKATLCPRSTKACRDGCVAAKSSNAKLDRSQRAAYMETVETGIAPGSVHAVRVDRIRFTSADAADVRFAILLEEGTTGFGFEGRAVRQQGRWLVSRDTFAQRVAKIGIQLPPPE